jgi:hypothetical protein
MKRSSAFDFFGIVLCLGLAIATVGLVALVAGLSISIVSSSGMLLATPGASLLAMGLVLVLVAWTTRRYLRLLRFLSES